MEDQKVKKPRSEKQIAAQKKAFAALKAKRETKKQLPESESEEEEPMQVQEVQKNKSTVVPDLTKAPGPSLVVKEQPKYITLDDFQSFKAELLESLKPKATPEPAAAPKVKKPPKTVPKTVVKIAEPPPQQLTGNALLDRIFFS